MNIKQTEILTIYYPQMSQVLSPYYTVAIPAGAGDSVEQSPEWINIDEYLRRGRVDAVVYVRARGDSMIEHGIFDGDLMVVLRENHAEIGDMVIAEVNGEFTIKKLEDRHQRLYLVPGNEKYEARRIKATDTFAIWGVIDSVVRRVRRAA
jgi:DNA polymerase V